MKNSRGWAAFGAVLMMAVGVFQILSGIFGLANDQWVILGYSGYFLVDVTGLAVWYIAIGAVLLLGGIAVIQGSRLGRIVGIVAASLAIVSQLLVLQIHPVWSVLLIALYVMALIAFVTVKGPLGPADEEPAALVDEEAAVPPAPVVPTAPVAAAAPLIAEAPAVAPEPATSVAPIVAPVVARAEATEEPVVRQSYDLADIEGIGPVYAEKLGDLGLKLGRSAQSGRQPEGPGRPGARQRDQRQVDPALGEHGRSLPHQGRGRGVLGSAGSRRRGYGPRVGPAAGGQLDHEDGRSERREATCPQTPHRRPGSELDRIGRESAESGHLLRAQLPQALGR